MVHASRLRRVWFGTANDYSGSVLLALQVSLFCTVPNSGNRSFVQSTYRKLGEKLPHGISLEQIVPSSGPQFAPITGLIDGDCSSCGPFVCGPLLKRAQGGCRARLGQWLTDGPILDGRLSNWRHELVIDIVSGRRH
jgi:hypothetical protein